MTDGEFRELFKKLDAAEPAEDAGSVTKLLRLAAALNEWDYPCVTRIECGYPVQDAPYVGDITLVLSNHRGMWEVTVRPSEIGELVAIIDPHGAIDLKRERELKAIFEDSGYVYVPARLLQERRPGGEGGTWFERFFQWA